MRFYSIALFIFVATVTLFNSCKNDLKILAPYKESVSVYAVLNPQDSLNYVRINKIFLGEGNAYVMATVEDSVNYRKGVLEVTLERTYFGTPASTSVGQPSKMKIVLGIHSLLYRPDHLTRIKGFGIRMTNYMLTVIISLL